MDHGKHKMPDGKMMPDAEMDKQHKSATKGAKPLESHGKMPMKTGKRLGRGK